MHLLGVYVCGMENIQIKPVSVNEVEALQQIARKIFVETFAEQNTVENMAKYLEESLSIDKLSAEVANPLSQFYFAVADAGVIGYLKLNTGEAQIENRQDNSLEIERIYVSKAFQGKRIGQMLFEKGIQVARDMNMDYVWLGVWEHNVKAIAFYNKNGFKPFSQHDFMLGDDVQTDILMKKELR